MVGELGADGESKLVARAVVDCEGLELVIPVGDDKFDFELSWEGFLQLSGGNFVEVGGVEGFFDVFDVVEAGEV